MLEQRDNRPTHETAHRVAQFCKAQGLGARGAKDADRHADSSRHGGNCNGLRAEAYWAQRRWRQ
jgi:hypothetical protein